MIHSAMLHIDQALIIGASVRIKRPAVKILILLVLAIWSVAPAYAQNFSDSRNWVDDGMMYWHKKDYQRASECFTEAMVTLGDNGWLHFYRGACYAMIDLWDKAIEDFNRAIDLGFPSGPRLGYGGYETDNRALAKLYNARGVCYIKKGSFERATADYERAVELDPENIKIKNNLAIIRNKLKTTQNKSESTTTTLPTSSTNMVSSSNSSTIQSQPTIPSTHRISGPKQRFFKPRLFVLSVGVSQYKDSRLNLRFAARDAASLAQALAKQSRRIFREVRVKVLTDAKVTRESVLKAMSSFLGRAVSTDVVLIFVAGHGVKKEQTGSFYFLPHPANPDNLITQGLGWYGFEEAAKLLSSRVKNVVLILDTCHAGAMKIATRGITRHDLSSPFKKKGFYTLAAAQPNEGAIEKQEWGHGAFTYAILEGLKGEADSNRNQEVDVVELFHYVEARVADLTDGQQHPHFRMGGGSLPLAACP